MRSLGEAAGLQAGDVIFSVNGQDISLLKHKEAPEAIKRAGSNIIFTIERYFLTTINTVVLKQRSQHLSLRDGDVIILF